MNLKKELKNLTSKLIEFKTTASNQEEFLKAFDYIEDYFKGEPCEINKYKKEDILSTVLASKSVKKPSKTKIILNGHIDVVSGRKEQFQPKLKNGKLFGRGALDMKGAVAAFLVAFKKYISENKAPSPIAVMIPGDEETGGQCGTRYLLNDIGWESEFAVIGEGRPEFALVTKEKGVVWLKLKTKGEASHSSRPWEGDNALKLLLDDLEILREMLPELESSSWETSLNIASISTPNNTINKIPSRASALVDIRFTKDFASTPKGMIRKIKQKLQNSKLEVKERGSLFQTSPDNPYLKQFRKVVADNLGKDPDFSYNPGASDARFFAENNLPAVVCGPTGDGIHADKEWVDLEFLVIYTKIIYQYLQSF